ncbi:MAG: hypothetical protein LBU23_10075 [Planctomycetota bacterium]|jgi:hypothetical protein|nr:hypothetical protein [Planctomycetota bacterium]
MGPRIPPALLWLLAGLLTAAVPLSGGEGDAYAQTLAHLEAINRQLANIVENVEHPPGPAEYPRRLLSLQKNAEISIGGEIRVNFAGVRANTAGVNPSGDLVGAGSAPGKSRLADFQVSTARLNLAATIGRRWRAFFEINLDGHNGFRQIDRVWNANPAASPADPYQRRRQTELIGQAYLEILKSGHSGFGLRIGLIKPSFGLTQRHDLFGQSFMDAPDLSAANLAAPENRQGGLRLPHASRFQDPVAAVMASYEMRDIIRFEAMVFQEDRRNRYGRYSGSDSRPPRSWQAGASFLPLEGWELSAALRNRHSRGRGIRGWADSPFRPDFLDHLASGKSDPRWDAATRQWSDAGAGPAFGSRKNEQALAIGLAAEIPVIGVAAQLEYAHGWNQGFNRHINSDDLNLGLSRRLTPFLTLFGQAEWLRVGDGSWLTAAGERDERNHRLYRFLLGAEYDLLRNLTLEAGWQYEYWRIVSSRGGGDGAAEKLTNTANLFYLGSRFAF